MAEDISKYETQLPESVLKQQRDAEAAMKKMSTPGDRNTDEDTAPVVEKSPVVESKEPVEKISTPAIPNANSDDAGFQHKYNVLRGKYDKEIGDLRSKVVELEAMIARQTQVIENNKQLSSGSGNTSDLGDINLEDFDSWGDEIKGMAKQMNALKAIISDQQKIISGLKASPASTSVDGELINRVESLEEFGRKQTVEAYKKTLDTACPSWPKLNTDAGFNAWLDLEDPVSMRVRRDIISNAASNFRGLQVANIFNQYLKEVGPASESSSIFEELPSGSASTDDSDRSGKPGVTLNDVKDAENKFIKGMITESEYDNVMSRYQKQLGRK